MLSTRRRRWVVFYAPIALVCRHTLRCDHLLCRLNVIVVPLMRSHAWIYVNYRFSQIALAAL